MLSNNDKTLFVKPKEKKDIVRVFIYFFYKVHL